MHKKLPHLIYFALATNYFNVFMSTTVLLGLTSFEKIGGQWIFGGASDFSNLLAPWASGSRSLMLRAEVYNYTPMKTKPATHVGLDSGTVCAGQVQMSSQLRVRDRPGVARR